MSEESVARLRMEDLEAFKREKHPVDAAALTALSTESFRRDMAVPAGISRSLILLGLFGTLPTS